MENDQNTPTNEVLTPKEDKNEIKMTDSLENQHYMEDVETTAADAVDTETTELEEDAVADNWEEITENETAENNTITDGTGLLSAPLSNDIPPGIKGWNWGAFTYSIFWGIGNKAYLTLLCFIPLFNIVWKFVCGFKGNEWAWKSGNFKTVEEFRKTQETWNRSGFIMFLINIFTSFLSFIIIYFLFFISMIFLAPFFQSSFLQSVYGEMTHSRAYDYNYNEEEDSSSVSTTSINDIPGWTQKMYDDIETAVSVYNEAGSKYEYSGGSSYEELVKKVGNPDEVLRLEEYGTVSAEWWSDDFEYIEIEYDESSGMIIDKYFSNE